MAKFLSKLLKPKSTDDGSLKPVSPTSQPVIPQASPTNIPYVSAQSPDAKVDSLQDAARPASSVHQPISSGSRAGPSSATKPQPQPNSLAASPSSCVSESLWDVAYDMLKKKHLHLVNEYETFLSSHLKDEHQSAKEPQMNRNMIEQTNKDKRQLQMRWLAQSGLDKNELEHKFKQYVGVTLQGVLSMKDVVGSALQAMPQAALAWTGVCFAMQVSLSTDNRGLANVGDVR